MARKYSKYVLKPGCKRECMTCRGETDDSSHWQCDVCKQQKPRASFGVSALRNRSIETQNTRCFECANLVCTAPNCPTCKKCRDPSCTSSTCNKEVRTLNSKYLPETHEDVLNFRCKRCSGIPCDLWKTVTPRSAFPDSVRKKANQSRKLRCLDCSNPPCQASQCNTCPTCRNPKCQKQKR